MATLFATSPDTLIERRALPLADLVLDPELQPRDGLDEETIERYASAMAAGVQLPDIVVYYDGTTYRLADGWHRHAAATRLQRVTISAEIHRGTRQEALLYALRANTEHGLQRRPGDLRRAVELALNNPTIARESDRRIAELCRCSHTYVSQVRKALSGNSCQIDDEETRIVRRGEQVYEQRVGEPEPTEADIAIARDLIPKALLAWTKPVSVGRLHSQVQKLEGGAGVTGKAVKAALYRMIEAGNVLEVKDAYNRTAYALAHDPAVQIEQPAPASGEEPSEYELANAFVVKLPELLSNGPLTYIQIRDQLCPEPTDRLRVDALRRALDTLFGQQRLKKDGGRYMLADSEPGQTTAVIDELNAKFDRSAITILGRTDDGAEHRAVDIARKLVAAGVWDGQTQIEFDAYALHDRLYGVERADPTSLVEGTDYTFIKRQGDLADRILALIADGPLQLAQIRARLGIPLNDTDGTQALRAALAELVADKRLRQVRDLYLPAAIVPATPPPPQDRTRSIRERILEILVAPLPIEIICERLGMTTPYERDTVTGALRLMQMSHDVQEMSGMWSIAEEPDDDDELDLFDAAARYRKYEMPAASVADFLARYYKTDRYTGRGEDYAAALLASYEERFEADGFVFISHHDSKTGEIVAYYGMPATPMDVLLDRPVVKPAPDEQQLPTQTAKDAAKIRDLLTKHAPMPLRMKYIREQLDMGETEFYRARMLLMGAGEAAQDGESLRLVKEAPKPPSTSVPPAVLIDATQDEPNGNGIAIHFSSESAEWYTPADIVERVVTALTGIDLDPCSNSQEAPNVPAAMHYTKADDGLAQEWNGKVFLNPPYGREIAQWVDKLINEFRAGRVTQAIALVPARTDTAWFAALRDFPRCFLQGRLTFRKPDGSDADPAPFPSALVYLGPDTDRFAEVFSDLGDIYVRYAPKEEGGVPV